MHFRTICSMAALAAAAVSMPAAAASIAGPTAVNPFTGGATAGGVRFRALNTSASQEEVYLGRHDLGAGGNRVAQNLTWTQNGANSFSLTFNAATDTLTSVVNGGSALNFANFTGGLTGPVAAAPLNRLVFSIRDREAGAGTISLSNLVLNGSALTGTLNGVEGTTTFWSVAGDFRQSFTLTGNLNLAGGPFASNENNNVQLLVGNAVPEPATWAMMIGGFGLVGAAMRRRAKVTVAYA